MNWPDVVMVTIVLFAVVYICLTVFHALTYKSPQLTALREMNTIMEEHLAIKSEREAILLVANSAAKVVHGSDRESLYMGLKSLCVSCEFLDIDLDPIFNPPDHDPNPDPIAENDQKKQ